MSSSLFPLAPGASPDQRRTTAGCVAGALAALAVVDDNPPANNASNVIVIRLAESIKIASEANSPFTRFFAHPAYGSISEMFREGPIVVVRFEGLPDLTIYCGFAAGEEQSQGVSVWNVPVSSGAVSHREKVLPSGIYGRAGCTRG